MCLWSLIKHNFNEDQLTYADRDLLLNRIDDLIYSTPLVLILGAAPDHAEAFQNVDDVIDASAFYSELSGALIQVEEAFLWSSI